MNPAFYVVVGLAATRGAELVYARFRAQGLAAMGARLVRDDGYAAIVVVQTLLLLGCAAQTLWTPTPWAPWKWSGVCLLALGFGLRYWSMVSLGPRWHTRVYVLPDRPLVATGPYRFLTHPIYVGVTLELIGLTVLCAAWWTLIILLPIHTWATLRRIRLEDAALGRS